MRFFEPMRDFFQQRAATRLTAKLPSVQIVVLEGKAVPGNAYFPGFDYSAAIEYGGEPVGHIEFGISPLADRVYVDMIRIASDQARKGIGLSTLWCLWNTHGVPLVPVHQYGTSGGFWSKARRRFAVAGALIEQELRNGELDIEKQRWQHLVPEPDHLRMQRQIMASPEWPEIKARWDREYGPCRQE